MSSVATPEQHSFPYHAESHGRLRAAAERLRSPRRSHAALGAYEPAVVPHGLGPHRPSSRRAGGARGRKPHPPRGPDPRVWLALEEVVTEHAPPTPSVWATVGTPQVLVVGPYRMGFALVPTGAGGSGTGAAGGATLIVFIDYTLPDRGLSRLLGQLFAHWYARWCTERMVTDARAAFATATPETILSARQSGLPDPLCPRRRPVAAGPLDPRRPGSDSARRRKGPCNPHPRPLRADHPAHHCCAQRNQAGTDGASTLHR
jgi:hypothetical protein